MGTAPARSVTTSKLLPGVTGFMLQGGFMESYRAEIAAHKLDRMLDLQMARIWLPSPAKRVFYVRVR